MKAGVDPELAIGNLRAALYDIAEDEQPQPHFQETTKHFCVAVGALAGLTLGESYSLTPDSAKSLWALVQENEK